MKALAEQIAELDGVEIYGRVVGVRGLMVEVAGPIHAMSVGRARADRDRGGAPDPVRGRRLHRRERAADAVRAARRRAARLPRGGLRRRRRVRPGAGWLGRVVNAMGEPIDGKGPLPGGPSPYPFRATPPPAHARRRVGAPLDLGVRALNTFLTCCRGQRLGIFLRLGRRQIGAALDAGAQRRGRRLGDRAGRRARARGAGVPAGRSRPGGPRALGGGGLDLRRARADAPPGGLSDARRSRNISATTARTCWC